MGNKASTPRPGTKFQVIGAGLSRTGTSSLSEALRILLDAPVYHCGTQTCTGTGPVSESKLWLKILRKWPAANECDAETINAELHQLLDGYAAVTDAPACTLIPELLHAYPDALVICTIRDPVAWEKSMVVVSSAARQAFLTFILLPIPSMWYFTAVIEELLVQWRIAYQDRWPRSSRTYERHIEWLKCVVPEDRLVFFDVREGWEPLCRVLGKEVPDCPFPRINDSKALERWSRRHVRTGLVRWAVILAMVGGGWVYLRGWV